VEVRFRSRTDFGEAEETVGAAKRRQLAILLGIFLARRSLPDGTPLPPLPRRVDLIVVEPGRGRKPQIRHHRGLELGG
jgi:Holliday junction resolvase-like predicted endonuclease